MKRRMQVLAMLTGGFLLFVLGRSAEEATASAAPDKLAPPIVRILTGERTTLADVRFFTFSCDASDPNKSALMFIGYRPDSFNPPIEDGQISPIHIIQFQRDGKWETHPQGWCGTGIDGIELPASQKKRFRFAVPVDLAGNVVRVGIRWSRPVEFATAKPEAFRVAWSKPFELRQIADAEEKEGVEERSATIEDLPPCRTSPTITPPIQSIVVIQCRA